MTQLQSITLATLGSFALLAGAFVFQALGYAPCQMCLWQRWPHAAAIVIGLAALATPALRRPLAVLGALAALTTAGIALFHTGVERGWWDGPTSCSGGAGLGNLSGDALLSTDIAPVVMCSDIVWTLAGLSMANYNALISLVLVAIWLTAARKRD